LTIPRLPGYILLLSTFKCRIPYQHSFPMTLNELISVLQVAVGPVILISGIGLLLLSMTNRFGRIIDRSRILAGVLRDADGVDRQRAIAQLRILMHRATCAAGHHFGSS
jgi:hypothetical protein